MKKVSHIRNHSFAPLVCHNLEELIGNTPLLKINTQRVQGGGAFWCKLEGYNPVSMKDRAAFYMISKARENGKLKEGDLIVESSSGAMGMGIALAGIILKHPVVIVSDPGLEPLVRNLLTAYGAKVEIVPRPHPTLGWQGARLARVREIIDSNKRAFWLQQYDNPDQVESYEGIAEELIQQLPRIDTLVCSVGTGGHSCGITQYLKKVWPELKLIGVDSVGSVIFGQPNGNRLIRGMGNSIYPKNVDYSLFDEIHWVAPREVVAACRELARNYFITGGWSTGSVYLVGSWIAKQIGSNQVVVGIFPDQPDRYFNSIFDEKYCKDHNLHIDSDSLPDNPQTVENPTEEIYQWTRCLNVIDPSQRNLLAKSA